MVKKKNNQMDISNLISLIIPLAIYGGMYKYLDDLEKNKECKCSENEKRKLLKNLVITTLSVMVVFNILPYILTGFLLNNLVVILGLLSIVLFIYLCYTFIKYETFLYKNDCKCSEDIKKTIFRYYLYTGMVLYALIILFNFLYIFFIIKSQSNKNVIRTNL
jgi:magnesium-transporting ATPase (P-type)|tara:strand:+ start:1363 stop:1848 length:486 start_codon:yes stop_codon:yes gene_type:complete